MSGNMDQMRYVEPQHLVKAADRVAGTDYEYVWACAKDNVHHFYSVKGHGGRDFVPVDARVVAEIQALKRFRDDAVKFLTAFAEDNRSMRTMVAFQSIMATYAPMVMAYQEHEKRLRERDAA